jgi:ATP-dependent RNA helicase DDX18/HAS1
VCTPALGKTGGLQGVVLDEVDVLLGDKGAFAEQVLPLMNMAGPATRLVLVTATLPEAVFAKLRELFPGMAAATGPNLHRIAVGVLIRLLSIHCII